MIIAVAAVATWLGCCAVIALALSRAAALADRDMESQARQLQRERGPRLRLLNGGYAGWPSAHATISREPSITVPSSSTSVGTQRFPVSSWTSRRPRV